MARSRAMRNLVAQLARFATSDANVLVTGETGAGKDAVVRALHQMSGRAASPFVTVDCPGLPASLLESELFGHERGAFTDATTARPGRFELAGHGTIYLDRVHELTLDLQAKLLRLVEQKQVERLGSSVAIPVQARVVASADERIEETVRDGLFRADLYHRLRVLPLRVPPLRERRGDIGPLTRRFLAASAGRAGCPRPVLTPDAVARLDAYRWPGNVRELQHTIERAVLVSPGGTITAEQLPLDDATHPESLLDGADREQPPTLAELERQYIALVLGRVKGSQTRAAALLGISRKALWEKRKRYGLA